MSRFKTSKYKNAFSHVHKKEYWINDLAVGSNLRSSGHHISCSCQYIAFIHDSNSVGALAVLPLNSHGRFVRFPTIAGHSGFVTDFTFSSFNDRLLASGGEDGLIKLWLLPDELAQECVISTPLQTVPKQDVKVESLLFHPTADNVLASAAGPSVKVWDIEPSTQLLECDCGGDCVQHVSWHGNGSLLASLAKSDRERCLRIFDVRSGKAAIAEAKCHSGLKDAALVWLGDSPHLASAGFNMTRNAELAVWDMSNLSKPLTKSSLGSSSTGSPMLFYDDDTKMLFLAVKSESTIRFFESSDKSPYMSQGNDVCHSPLQTKGLAMLPKRAVDVMSCEVSRFMQLTQNAVVPISYHVQRKSHSEFHSDLFPDTAGATPALSAKEWASGNDAKVTKVSLDPAKVKTYKPAPSGAKVTDAVPTKTSKVTESGAKVIDSMVQGGTGKVEESAVMSSAPSSHPSGGKAKVASFVRSSHFRHIEGQLSHRNTTIDKLPPLSTTVPGDSDAFDGNKERVAVVLSTVGGQVAVLELSKAGRLDTNVIPTLQNTADVMDIAFDPFNSHRVVIACDDAKIKVWTVPDGGLTHTLTQPDFCLIGHQEKPNVLAFHPQADSILASGGYDGKLLLWNLTEQCIVKEIDHLPQPLFALAWSVDGSRLATFSKDHRLRVFDPRSSTCAVAEGDGPVGSRGGRIVWIDQNTFVVSGFNRTSVRTLGVYSVKEGTITAKAEISTNISPATLMPHFDPDTKLLFVSGKGDTSIMAYEYVPTEAPFLFEVSPFACGSPHQAYCVLPKILCDVKHVEILKGARLTKTSIEQFSVRVPRTRLEYFQDDIYPPTLVHWNSALTANEWLTGKNCVQATVSLQPPGMKPLSEAPKAATAAKKFPSYNPDIKSDEQKKEELLSAMIGRMGEKDEEPLPQTTMDGCDSDEWSD